MLYEQLDSIRNKWIVEQSLDIISPVKPAALTATILYFLDIPENKDTEVSKETLDALTTAIAIDKTNLHLNKASIEAIKSVQSILPNTNNCFITDLPEAISLLSANKIPLQKTQIERIIRVFKAIDSVTNQVEAIPAQVIPINIIDAEETFVFYFHGENYADNQERKEALARLKQSILTIWNDALENEQLPFFLNSILSGPCVEGATRKAIKQYGLSLQNERSLPADFDDIMEMLYYKASAFLQALHLPETLLTIRDVILSTHNGKKCLEKENCPNTINPQSVLQYCKQLGVLSTRLKKTEVTEYFDETQEALSKLDIHTRLAILTSLEKFAPPETLIEFNKYLPAFDTICSLTKKPLSSLEINQYIACLLATNTLLTPIYKNFDAIFLALLKNQEELFLALLDQLDIDINYINSENIPLLSVIVEYDNFEKWLRHFDKPISLKGLVSVNANTNVSALMYLILKSNKTPFLLDLLDKNPTLRKSLTAETLCLSVKKGPITGFSALYGLVQTLPGLKLLHQLVTEGLNVTGEALCKHLPKNRDGNTGAYALYWLVQTPEGRNLLQLIFTDNLALQQSITAEALCRPITEGPRTGLSVLSWLCTDSISRKILQELFTNNTSLTKDITGSDLCSPIMNGNTKGNSALSALSQSLIGRGLLLKIFTENPSLVQDITAEALCRPAVNGDFAGSSALYWLAKNKDGYPILMQLLTTNAALLANISPEALCRPVEHGKDAVTPLFYLTTYFEGCKILELLFKNNISIPAKDLCRIPQEPFADLSILFRLAGTPEGCNVLLMLFNNNLALQQAITSEDLLRPVQRGSAAGVTALIALARTAEGCKILELLLNANPDLRKSINLQILTQPIGNSSVLKKLLSHPDSKNVLDILQIDNPSLAQELQSNRKRKATESDSKQPNDEEASPITKERRLEQEGSAPRFFNEAPAEYKTDEDQAPHKKL